MLTTREAPAAYSLRTRSARSASPPAATTMPDTSSVPISSTAPSSDGTPAVNVGRGPVVRAGVSNSERTRCTVPPSPSAGKISTVETSKDTEVAAIDSIRQLVPKICQVPCTIASTARCGIETPLGTPVEPDV